ncbi:uncharacterized protein [Nicotiana tomentosiformis]|uniref:uncharacterized protein n=1 Tax=Nicotiana tomentosiformis TaxID=4098 RepID=UPI00388C8019
MARSKSLYWRKVEPMNERGIEVNPAQIKTIEEIPDILTNKKKFEWTEECQPAHKTLKAYISNPPLLGKPKDGERLFVYLAVSEMAVSAVLIREDKGRLAKWAIKLSEYDIMYQSRTAIKSQVLADFVAEFSTKIVPEVEKELQIFTGSNLGTWTLFTNGSSNIKGASLGIVLIPPSGESIRQAIKCYPITNNEAEYEAVITGLELARELSIEKIVIKSDSQLYGTVPEGKKESQSLRRKAARYCLIRGNLYRKIFGGPLARCLGPAQTEYVMKEVHEGHCGNHAGGRSLVKTLIRAGYYWPKNGGRCRKFCSKV